ncbi:MAG: HEAT repeat domain-containing protein [Vampirovibrionales bacterium]|nr:HEAT repeat domain-containing protein [Vampirovibrionales bacterium]
MSGSSTPFQTEVESTCAAILSASTEPKAHRLNALAFLVQQIGSERFCAFEALLCDILNNHAEDAELRSATALALGQFGSADVLNPLLKATSDSDRQVRQYAAEALGRMGNEAAIPTLLERLTDTDNDVFLMAANALGQMGTAAVSPLSQLLSQPQTRHDVRCAAAWQLGQIQESSAVEPLMNVVETELASEATNEELTALCVWALGEIGCELNGVRQILLRASQHPQPSIADRAKLASKKIARHIN